MKFTDFVGNGFWCANENDMNGLNSDIPSTTSKLPTTKFCLPETGFIRLKNIIAPHGPIPVSRSTWWAGVKSKRFPQPVKLGPRFTAWRVEDIRALIERLERMLHSWGLYFLLIAYLLASSLRAYKKSLSTNKFGCRAIDSNRMIC